VPQLQDSHTRVERASLIPCHFVAIAATTIGRPGCSPQLRPFFLGNSRLSVAYNIESFVLDDLYLRSLSRSWREVYNGFHCRSTPSRSILFISSWDTACPNTRRDRYGYQVSLRFRSWSKYHKQIAAKNYKKTHGRITRQKLVFDVAKLVKKYLEVSK